MTYMDNPMYRRQVTRKKLASDAVVATFGWGLIILYGHWWVVPILAACYTALTLWVWRGEAALRDWKFESGQPVVWTSVVGNQRPGTYLGPSLIEGGSIVRLGSVEIHVNNDEIQAAYVARP